MQSIRTLITIFYVTTMISCSIIESPSKCEIEKYQFDTLSLMIDSFSHLEKYIHYYGGKIIVPIKNGITIDKEYLRHKRVEFNRRSINFCYEQNDYKLIILCSYDINFKKDMSKIDSSDLVIVDPNNNPYITINESFYLSSDRFLGSQEDQNYQIFIERDSTSLIKYFFWTYKNSLNRAKIRLALFRDKEIVKWGSPIYKEIIGCSHEYFLLDFSKERVDSIMLDSLLF